MKPITIAQFATEHWKDSRCDMSISWPVPIIRSAYSPPPKWPILCRVGR